MEGWFITMLVFVGIILMGYTIHSLEERAIGVKMNIDNMETFGSIIFLLGVVGVFSLVMTILCI